VAKGVITPPSCLHVSYVHTPMRYVWDQFADYFGPGRAGVMTRLAALSCAPFLRAWDESSSLRVDRYLANSAHVAERIRKRYRREATVIHPPVELSRFKPLPRQRRGDYYLMVGAFAPYKRVDLAIDAFSRLGRPLKIVGAGQDAKALGTRATYAPGVELLGPQPDSVIAELYARCRAFVFPGEEDFGITPLEAQASGRPVIAFGRGGALETVVPLSSSSSASASASKPTGVFFNEQTVDSLIDAVRRFESAEDEFDPAALRAHAESFDRAHFKRKIEVFLRNAQSNGPTPPIWPSRPALA
jgi:glycosyltransferase involved in cell wall biosynthesis